jgi:hypothetical protein
MQKAQDFNVFFFIFFFIFIKDQTKLKSKKCSQFSNKMEFSSYYLNIKIKKRKSEIFDFFYNVKAEIYQKSKNSFSKRFSLLIGI